MVCSDCTKTCAVPAKDPWIDVGRPIARSASAIAASASLNDFPGATLKATVVETNAPWWFTASGVWPSPRLAKAESGIIVSNEVLTAGADDAVPLPTFASAFVAALREELAAIDAAVVADDVAPDLDA